jgi:type IV pilus assembly protein PilE
MQAIVGSRGAREAGFTLIELMVTIVIGAILVTIAVPSYTSQVRKSRRTDAKTALLDLATREERYSSLNNAYTNVSASLGYGTGGFPQSVGSGYYNIGTTFTITPAAPQVAAAFTVTATPIGPQTKDTQCQIFSIDQTGKQHATDSGGNDTTTICWN